MVEKVLTAVLDAEQTIASELVQVAEALEDVAKDASVSSETMDKVANAADGARNSFGAAKGAIQGAQEGLEDLDLEARQAAQTQEALSKAAERASQKQGVLGGSAEATAKAIDEESDSFKEAFASAESLEEAKGAASKANEVLSETADATKRALNEEMSAMVKMAQSSSTGAELVDKLRNSNLALSGAVSKVDKDISDMNADVAANEILIAATAEEVEGLAVSQTKLASATTTTTEELEDEAQTFREALVSADSLAEAKNAASVANSKLSATARKTEEAVEDELGAMYRMVVAADSVSEFIDQLRNSNLAAAKTADTLEESMDDASVSMLSAALNGQVLTTILDGTEDKLEEVSDKAQQAALSIAGLGGAFSSTSLNIGPFNFALRRAAVQIPQLVITTGALATSLLGLASAAGIAGGALAGIFAGGLIAKADRVAASSSDIEGRLEALEEIAGNVREMFIRALEPLIDAESVAIFEATITSLAGAVNLLAQVADNLQDELVAAGNEVSNAFGDNTTAILTEMEDTVEAFLPLIVDLIGYFADHLPNALQFFQNEGVAFTQTLGEFGKQIVGFFKTFTDVGIPILEGAITAIRGVLKSFEMVANVLNTLPDGVLETAFAFLFLSRVFDSVLAKFLSVGMFFSNFGGSVLDASGALATFNSVLGGLELSGIQRGLGNLLQKFNLLKPVVANSSDAAADAMRGFPELNLQEPGSEIDEDFSDFTDPINAAVSKARSKFNELRTAASNKVSDIATSLRTKASDIKNALVAPFNSAKNAIASRLAQINQITGSRDLATDVALGGPRLTDDQQPEDVVVDTKTGQARRKLAALRDSVRRTRSQIKESLAGGVETALDVRFEDSGLRDMQTGQFTTFSNVLRDRVTGAFTVAKEGAKSFATSGLSLVEDGINSVGARGVGLASIVTGVGEAFVSAVPGLGNFSRATDNIRSGLGALSPELVSFKDSLVGAIPTMSEANDAALSFTDGLQSRMDPHLDSLNQKLLTATDSLDSAISPALDSANDRLLNFADALDPSQDLSFYDILSSKVSSIVPSTEEAKAAILGIGPSMDELNNKALGVTDAIDSAISPSLDRFNDKALDVTDSIDSAISPALDSANDRLLNFADALDPNQDLTFYDILSSKVSSIVPSTEEAKAAILGIGPSMDELNDKALTVTDAIDSAISPSLDRFNDKALDATDSLDSAISPALDRANDRLLNFSDALDPSQDLTFYDIFRDKVSLIGQSLRSTLGPPLKTAKDSLFELGGAVRDSGNRFAGAINNIDGYQDAVDLVSQKTDRVKDSIGSLAGGAIGRVRTGLNQAKTAVLGFAGSLIPANIGTQSLTTSIYQLAVAPLSAIGTLAGLASTLFTQGSSALFASIMNSSLASSLMRVSGMGIPVVSNMAAVTLSFFSTAAASTVATAAVTALSVALSSIGWTQIVVAITAVVAAAALLAGVLSNMEGVSKAVGGTIQFLKGVLESIFNFLLAIGVPTWNVLIDVLEVLGAFIFPFIDAFNRLGKKLGFVSEKGSATGGVFDAIGTAFAAVGDAIGFVIGLLKGPLNVVADIIYAAIAIPLFAIVDAIVLVIDVIDYLISAFMSLPIVQDTLSKIQQGIQLVQDAFSGLGSIIAGSVAFVESMLEGMVNFVINHLNGLIEGFNDSTPEELNIETIGEFDMGDSGGAAGRLSSADASAEQARENAASMTEEDNENAQEDQAPAPKHETNNYENNEYNFGDFNMNPEEKARVKGLVQDAINEANREQRFRDGGN